MKLLNMLEISFASVQSILKDNLNRCQNATTFVLHTYSLCNVQKCLTKNKVLLHTFPTHHI